MLVGTVRTAIRQVRSDLLAKHLGTTPDQVARAFSDDTPSLIGAIDRLNRETGGRLCLDPPALTAQEWAMAENRVLDPEQPWSLFTKIRKTARLQHPA